MRLRLRGKIHPEREVPWERAQRGTDVCEESVRDAGCAEEAEGEGEDRECGTKGGEESMKAFKVFWKDTIRPKPLPYEASATVVAESFESAMNIAKTYGEISSIHSESDLVIMEKKTEDISPVAVDAPLPTEGDEVVAPVGLRIREVSIADLDAEVPRG